jgi:hypothetical protein
MATQAGPSQMGWQPKVESKGARLGGGGLATLAMPVVGAGGEGNVQHHGEGVKLLWVSRDTGAHHATPSTVAVSQRKALVVTAWMWSRGTQRSG